MWSRRVLPGTGGIVLGLDERNQRIPHLIGERIRAHQLQVIVAGDFNFPVSVLAESGWMKRLQLHLPTFVTRNGVSSNDFVLVSNVLLSRGKDAFVELEGELPGHRLVCFRVAHRGPMPRFQVLVRGAALKFVRKHSCKAHPADIALVSEVLRSAEQ